ncbi:MAG: imidazolonepropionase-like amidohydrolase [Candidatus Azotimanducaceae bacterium]|jgi:imidazolonepropionase-like amidohydrolase
MWLTNLDIWDGVSDNLSEFNALEITGSKITSLGMSKDQKLSQDMGGLTVIPGLIDAHVHMCLDPEAKDPLEHVNTVKEKQFELMGDRAHKMLMAGITTARDLGGGKWQELTLRDQINQGERVGVRLLCSGQPVTSINGHCHFWGGEAANLEDAKKVINRQISRGVDLIKIMATGGSITPGSRPVDAQFDADTMLAMVELAHEHDLLVAAHCHGTEGIKNASFAGVNTIEHCSWVGPEGWGKCFDESVLIDMVNKDIWISPTINYGWKKFIGSKMFEDLVKDNYQKMKAAGVKLIASTDAGIPNVRHQDLPLALPIFAHFASLNHQEVLRAATSDCAEALGVGESRGKIAVGYDADLVFLQDNPLLSLKALENPASVMGLGILHESVS